MYIVDHLLHVLIWLFSALVLICIPDFLTLEFASVWSMCLYTINRVNSMYIVDHLLHVLIWLFSALVLICIPDFLTLIV